MKFQPVMHDWAFRTGGRWADIFARSKRTDPDAFFTQSLAHAGPALNAMCEDVRKGFDERLAEKRKESAP